MTFKVPPHLLSLLILFLSLCLTSLALRRDPETAEVPRCLEECSDEDVQEHIACHKECELQYREREERREEEEKPGSRELDPRWRHRHGHGGGGGGGEWEPQREREERERPGGGDVNLSLATTTEDPQQQFRHCQQKCEQQHRREPQRRQCRQECERQFREQRRGTRISTNPRGQELEEEEELGEWGENPYYFHSWTLRSRFRSEEGRIRVLEQFDRRSDLLRGLKNYRLAIFEANPSTFVLPHHIDADCILVVLKG